MVSFTSRPPYFLDKSRTCLLNRLGGSVEEEKNRFSLPGIEPCSRKLVIDRLTPNDPYMSLTAPLTSKRCILCIYSTNVGTEYFKHALYSQFFSLENAICFIMLTSLVRVLFTFYIQGVLKLKKNNSGAKGLSKPRNKSLQHY